MQQRCGVVTGAGGVAVPVLYCDIFDAILARSLYLSSNFYFINEAPLSIKFTNYAAYTVSLEIKFFA